MLKIISKQLDYIMIIIISKVKLILVIKLILMILKDYHLYLIFNLILKKLYLDLCGIKYSLSWKKNYKANLKLFNMFNSNKQVPVTLNSVYEFSIPGQSFISKTNKILHHHKIYLPTFLKCSNK
jgi:hypothetical protein